MTELEQYINVNFGVAGDELSRIASMFEPEVVNNGDFYIKSGAACDELSFVQSGLLRLFATLDEKDTTQWIFSKGYFIGDMPSLTFSIPRRGIIDWNQVISTLVDARYNGVFMYEVVKKEGDDFTFKD